MAETNTGGFNINFPSEMTVKLSDELQVHTNYKDDLTIKIAIQLYTYGDFEKIKNPTEFAKTCLLRANYFVKAYKEMLSDKLPASKPNSETNKTNFGGTTNPDSGNEGGTNQPDSNNPTNREYEYLLNILICTDIEDETYINIINANYINIKTALELELESPNIVNDDEPFYLFNGNDEDYNDNYNIAIRKIGFDKLLGNIENITESKQLSLNVYWKRTDTSRSWELDDRKDTLKYSNPNYTIDAIKISNDNSFNDELDDTIDDNITNTDS